MRHYSKSHGRHCYLRSFRTSCPKCGADVLYWECSHGSKVFFQYPPYGKLIKHYCRNFSKGSKQKDKYKVIVKTPKYLLDNIYLNCPICGKPFKDMKNLRDHFNQMRKIDSEHKSFFSNQIKFKEECMNLKSKKYKRKNSEYKPKFGRINIRKNGKQY